MSQQKMYGIIGAIVLVLLIGGFVLLRRGGSGEQQGPPEVTLTPEQKQQAMEAPRSNPTEFTPWQKQQAKQDEMAGKRPIQPPVVK